MKIRVITIVFLISFFMSSCFVYHTQMTDIPLISKRNDLRIDGGISMIPLVYSTISYGMTDKIAIQGFGSFGADESYYFQAATGFYKIKGDSRVLELYGGFGYGYGDSQGNDDGLAYGDGSKNGKLLGNYQLYFGQLNYGKIANESSNLEIGIGIKTGYLCSNLTDRNYYNWISETGPFETYHDKSILIEPAGFIRFGGGKLKSSIKLGGTLIYKFTNTDKNLPYYNFNIGLGLNYRL